MRRKPITQAVYEFNVSQYIGSDASEEEALIVRLRPPSVGDALDVQDSSPNLRYNFNADGRVVNVEREMRGGEAKMRYVLRCLVDWNLYDEETGAKVPITRETVSTYLELSEFEAIYGEIERRMNPGE